jgi:alpha/beta superfamily hydrolase
MSLESNSRLWTPGSRLSESDSRLATPDSRLSGNTFFEGPAGRIEAILKVPDAPVQRAAIVCHPHPLFGGTMHNKVVFRIARTFEDADFAVLRFNFRGAGLSEGTHDEGRGEQDDLRAAMSFMKRKFPAAKLWLAGFSFGSAVMMRVGCKDPGPVGLVAAGFPVSKYELRDMLPCPTPKLFIQGSLDEFGPVDQLEQLFSNLPEPKQLVIVHGADHFFQGHLAELREAVTGFIKPDPDR